jgi:hypothetical protein
LLIEEGMVAFDNGMNQFMFYSLPSDFESIDKFRNQEAFLEFAKDWIDAELCGNLNSNFHLNIYAWIYNYPQYVLAIILNLLDLVENYSLEKNEKLAESIALGPVEWLVTRAEVSFLPTLKDAMNLNNFFIIYYEALFIK